MNDAKTALRILHLEDNPDDAQLIRRKLSKDMPGCQVHHVENEEQFGKALESSDWNLILADYSMPSSHGLDALALARQLCPSTPFLFVSGMMGEETAVESLKAGATDYVLKDRPARLVPAIRRALELADARERRERDEEEMRRIQGELQKSNEDLRRRNEEIQNFYHTLSHELKTPLTSAKEFISIVMDGLAGPLNETQLEYLGIAKEGCDQLGTCMNDLLDATRLDTGKLRLEFKPAALEVLVQRAAAAFGPAAARKQLSLKTEVQRGLPPVPLDEHRIAQVISNLLTNALKYTASGGEILMKVGFASSTSELLQVTVSDTGCGIPKEDQDRVFDRLYQVRAGDAATGQGVGLGLYLCREFIELHGGRIWVESAPGKGSAFCFVLPTNQQLLRSNVLIVDDDPALLEMLCTLLQMEFNVRTARDGLEALKEMNRQAADVVLLDLVMPALDGARTLSEIRKSWGAVPVIVHTGHVEGELMDHVLTFSPFTLLGKPCSPNRLLEAVRKVERGVDTAIWKKNHHNVPKPLFQHTPRS
ncbi:MAG TPA: response regulator [Verrucomicrobiae bacterium]|nr:response regulator [Verrucomicrobiae bacterium]